MTPAATPEVTPEGEMHAKHSIDGYPLCWPQDRDGDFTATPNDRDVTCRACQDILNSYGSSSV